ncbi:unnamed protein product (mitochondrion) [Plasmodiophora brassicae]|uniref:Uncharacterized protein n=1 Tax=Plasmodiophora brassicae TaxID=37360 RepID=A0A3P3Y882_PLABS|nr:unnamed protein product [Plasmodiophora brassicae]
MPLVESLLMLAGVARFLGRLQLARQRRNQENQARVDVASVVEDDQLPPLPGEQMYKKKRQAKPKKKRTKKRMSLKPVDSSTEGSTDTSVSWSWSSNSRSRSPSPSPVARANSKGRRVHFADEDAAVSSPSNKHHVDDSLSSTAAGSSKRKASASMPAPQYAF